MNETLQQPDPQAPHPGFCQICGRGVVSDADRLAGRAFPCGLCNEVKLAAPIAPGYPGPEPIGSTAVPGAGPIPPGAVPPVAYPGKDVPNPGLAALLGLIPGVGAMYNGQYPKGIVHLIVFAILASLADSNGIFGFLAFVWVCYQAIEAHHTARARRDGSLLPNPFGLNDIGERLGFGKSWPAYPPTPNPDAPPAQSWSQPPVPPAAPPQQPPTANWGGAPWGTYHYQVPPVPPIPPFTPPPPYPPFSAVPPTFDGQDYPFDPTRAGFESPHASRFPAGAIWLIALGTLFLLNTSGVFHAFNFRVLLPLFFIGLGVWQFIHKMTRSGLGFSDDGSPAYRVRLFRATRGAVWLILLGVIFFLADFNILSWGRSWPLFLILAGVMAFSERAVYRGASPAMYGYPPPYPPSPQAGPPPPSPTSSDPSTVAVSTVSTAELDPNDRNDRFPEGR